MASNTAFLSQFGVTICLAVSFKAMWNLMHVMQVIAYLRLAVNWPANTSMMQNSIHNALTLENLIKYFTDKFKDEFDGENDEETERLL